MTQQLQEALYIQDLIDQKNDIKQGLLEENQENIWFQSAMSLPDHYHSDNEPDYLGLLSGLEGFDCHEDAPTEAIETLKKYINNLINENAVSIHKFMRMRLKTIKDNIKSQKAKFKADWGITWKQALLNGHEDVNYNLNLDDILDKINAKGMDSLTSVEKNFLKNNGNKDSNDDKDSKK